MNIRKCDRCKKILEPDKSAFFSVPEISYHFPGACYARMHHSHSEFGTTETKMKESWVDYRDLDFCEACFRKESLYDFIKERIRP